MPPLSAAIPFAYVVVTLTTSCAKSAARSTFAAADHRQPISWSQRADFDEPSSQRLPLAFSSHTAPREVSFGKT